MDEFAFQPPPKTYEAIITGTRRIGLYEMVLATSGALLRVMAALKPSGRMLETGTGTGVGTCWLLDGMEATARPLILIPRFKPSPERLWERTRD